MNGTDVFLKKRITRCKQIDDVFDLLDNDTFVIEPVSCKSEHSISSTCFIISDKTVGFQISHGVQISNIRMKNI